MALDGEQANEHWKCGPAKWRGGPLGRRRRPTPRERWPRHPGVGQQRVLKLPGRRTGAGWDRRDGRRGWGACRRRGVSCRGMRCTAGNGPAAGEQECDSDGTTHASGSHDHRDHDTRSHPDRPWAVQHHPSIWGNACVVPGVVNCLAMCDAAAIRGLPADADEHPLVGGGPADQQPATVGGPCELSQPSPGEDATDSGMVRSRRVTVTSPDWPPSTSASWVPSGDSDPSRIGDRAGAVIVVRICPCGP